MSSAAELIGKGYGGYAGWGDAEASADYAATGGAGKLTGGGDAGGEGGRSADSLDYGSIPSVQGFIAGQFPVEDQALTDLAMTMRAREKPLDIYQGLEQQAGLPALRATSATLSKEIGNLEDALSAVEGNVAARTRESLVTEAQRAGMVEAGRQPYVENLTKLGTAAGRIGNQISTAEATIGTKTQLAMTGQEQDLEPLKLRYTAIVDRNARLTTGFTADRETLLQVMFDKLTRQRQLSDQEWALANTIASEQRAYDRELGLAAAKGGGKITGGESSNQLLSMIGNNAAAQLVFENRIKQHNANTSGGGGGGNTITERTEKTQVAALRTDISNGENFETLVRRYPDLPAYLVRNEYNLGPIAKSYGKASEPESTVQGWRLKKAETGTGQISITRPDGSVISF